MGWWVAWWAAVVLRVMVCDEAAERMNEITGPLLFVAVVYSLVLFVASARSNAVGLCEWMGGGCGWAGGRGCEGWPELVVWQKPTVIHVICLAPPRLFWSLALAACTVLVWDAPSCRSAHPLTPLCTPPHPLALQRAKAAAASTPPPPPPQPRRRQMLPLLPWTPQQQPMWTHCIMGV